MQRNSKKGFAVNGKTNPPHQNPKRKENMKTKIYEVGYSVKNDPRLCYVFVKASSKKSAVEIASSQGPEVFMGGSDTNPPDDNWWNAARATAKLICK